ncbi:sulfatase [Caproiciproducens galactitolivorans]|uniref:Sulfatase n=1 Tax=Caproiciproducens galactitolivorans TaxID=642589 RepID=A0ABT4BWX8_9FIRM|nr:sulfatase [Caproiciproducens galactitolivorans]MCY1714446.1 sulfatase [Caproiciproducens galactitolivorans]
MRAIMLLFDSLNRHMLAPYGCDWTYTPNFQRLANRAVTFDNCYAGSLPCIPARRELHTGRLNFLHRSWGPLEPFDDSMPEILRKNGIYTHLISDHQHYWEDGGCTYHNRYNSWEFVRGQEGDRWKGCVKDPEIPSHLGRAWRQDVVNRSYINEENKQPQKLCFDLGLEFLEKNRNEDNWFLHLELFDPHEPFYTMQRYKELYPHKYDGPQFDWPPYDKVTESPEAVQHCRYEYAALLSMCDHYLGKLLDYMDANHMWDDTMLIVNTDHGFLLSEHDCWAKCVHPFYNEIAHIPLFIWDPRSMAGGVRRSSLVQGIDLPATILDFFHLPIPADMQGKPLKDTIENDRPVRQAALFGLHGAQINVTDGRYVYMRDPIEGNSPLYNYTLIPTHMRSLFSVEEMQNMKIAQPFSFTKNCPLMKIKYHEDEGGDINANHRTGTKLYDLSADPKQEYPIENPAVEKQMISYMIQLMKENDCPAEQFERMGLTDYLK